MNSVRASSSASRRSRQRSAKCISATAARDSPVARPMAARIVVGVDPAHQLADVLHVPAPPFVARDLVREVYRFAQLLGQLDARQLVAAQVHELLPERLQRVHLLLALRLARAIAVRQVLFVRRVVVDHRCL